MQHLQQGDCKALAVMGIVWQLNISVTTGHTYSKVYVIIFFLAWLESQTYGTVAEEIILGSNP